MSYDEQRAPQTPEPRFNTMGPRGNWPVNKVWDAPDPYVSRTDAASVTPNTISPPGVPYGLDKGNYIVTASGRKFSLTNPRPEDADLNDIATALSRIPRFCGHAPHSVAQHSVLVERLLPLYVGPGTRLIALLHDAHEAYLGDMSTPVARELASRSGQVWYGMKALVQAAIHRAVGLPPVGCPAGARALVKQADQRALLMERDRFLSRPGDGWGPGFPVGVGPNERFDSTIEAAWSPREAREAFLARIRRVAREMYPRPNVPPALREFVR